MKNTNPRSFFDEEFRLEKLLKQKDPLVKLSQAIDWEIFRPVFESVFKKQAKGKGGRPSYDYVMMFKTLILQRYYNLSDDQIEYQILDRLSFMRFLSLKLSDKVPDSKTVWHFREQLTKASKVDTIFERFNKALLEKGLLAEEGTMIDASFVDVPKQRNSKEENKQIKEGNIPDEWKKNPHKLAQKDTDARWTKKNGVSYYGYKDHVKADTKSKLIQNYEVTEASVHDSQVVEDLLDNSDEGKELYADSAYSGKPVEKTLKSKKVKNKIHEKGYKNKPLTEQQKQNNKEKSKTRARVEHIFGFIENNMGGSFIRSIGKARAVSIIGLMNLTYNMFRYIQLCEIHGISMS